MLGNDVGCFFAPHLQGYTKIPTRDARRLQADSQQLLEVRGLLKRARTPGALLPEIDEALTVIDHYQRKRNAPGDAWPEEGGHEEDEPTTNDASEVVLIKTASAAAAVDPIETTRAKAVLPTDQ